MNRYESHYYKTVRIKELVLNGLRNGYYWIGIDDLIARIDAFPEQDLALSHRLAWAKDRQKEGHLFVVSRPNFGNGNAFELIPMKRPPSMGYRHISKLWRDCK